MLKFRNVTSKENFRSYADWAEERITPKGTDWPRTCVWLVEDRFGNAWTVTFTGEVGDFTVEGKTSAGTAFKVWLYLSGDSAEIVKAYDGGRNIRSDRLLGKYKELACMVSNYFRFNLL